MKRDMLLAFGMIMLLAGCYHVPDKRYIVNRSVPFAYQTPLNIPKGLVLHINGGDNDDIEAWQKTGVFSRVEPSKEKYPPAADAYLRIACRSDSTHHTQFFLWLVSLSLAPGAYWKQSYDCETALYIYGIFVASGSVSTERITRFHSLLGALVMLPAALPDNEHLVKQHNNKLVTNLLVHDTLNALSLKERK